MNKITKLILCTLAGSMLYSSCSLDREPSDYINYDKAFQTIADAEKWDNGLYSTLRGKFGGAYILLQEAQADMLNAHAAYGNLYAEYHGWDQLRAENREMIQVYHSYYSALIDANVVIEKIPTIRHLAKTPADNERLDHFLGDAYLARAYYHFSLAMRWGQVYREATAETDLCVPMNLKSVNLEKASRATNRQVYDQILSDLEQAEKLLVTMPKMKGNKEISADVATALRARVLLYMGRMQEALEISERLIGSGVYPLIPAEAVNLGNDGRLNNPATDKFVRMWNYDSGEEQIWQPHIDKQRELPTTTGLYGADLTTWQYMMEKHPGRANQDFNRPAYLPAGWVVYNLFEDAKDRRVYSYFEYVTTTVKTQEPINLAELFVVSKFKGNPEYANLTSTQWGGYVPTGVQAPKPFRIAEQYLIAAEAAYDTGDVDKAKAYLAQLRASRGLETPALEGEELQKLIRDERTRELAYEGYRLWDLRRWGQGINGRSRQGIIEQHQVPATFFATDASFDIQIPADHPKFIWGFPQNEVAHINPKNLKQNRGW